MSIDSILLAGGALGAYTRGLSTISDNISNMNTTAYKGKRLSYEAVPGEANPGAWDTGAPFGGVSTQDPVRLYKQGDLQKTGSDYDFGIQGEGYFALQDGNRQVYTRAGNFTFNPQGQLVQQGSKLPLLVYDSADKLNPVVLSPDKRISAGKATTTLTFANILNSGSTSFDLADPVSIYNATGNAVQVKLSFALNPDVTDEWTITVTSTDAAAREYGTGTIKFMPSGNIDPTSMQFNVAIPASDGTSQAVTFDFADARSYSTLNSTLSLDHQDGLAAGQISTITISTQGELVANYSNGNTLVLGTIALARTNTPDQLTARDFGNFSADNARIQMTLDKAGTHGLGTVQQGVLEASNVDLTQEFSNLIITQRGYQAASQVITTTNEMLGLLFNIRGQN